MVIPGAGRVGRTDALLTWAAIVLVVADTIAYRLVLRSQGDLPPDSVAVVPFVSGYMLLMTALLGLSFLGHPRQVILRPAMLAFAAAGLLLLGIIAMFSIGLPLFVAGILASIAAVRALSGGNSRNAVLSQVAAAAIALTVLVGGFTVTSRIIVCPPTGTMGGGGSGFISGAYHYECVNGTLTWHEGECGNFSGGVDANGNAFATSDC